MTQEQKIQAIATILQEKATIVSVNLDDPKIWNELSKLIPETAREILSIITPDYSAILEKLDSDIKFHANEAKEHMEIYSQILEAFHDGRAAQGLEIQQFILSLQNKQQ